jgi:GT2 family glycosyltransferase
MCAEAIVSVAIVIVTYRRPTYLAALLSSIVEMRVKPERVIVIDNASGDETGEVVEHSRSLLEPLALDYFVLPANVGGAGGFCEGMKVALEGGAEWIWLMDDDVTVLPDGLFDLLSFSNRYHAMIGRREDFNGRPYFFQTFFNTSFGIHLPRPGNVFKHGDVWETNLCSFEGFFVHRSIAQKVGLPDPRFFITWDDVTYGWLVSRITPIAYVNRIVLRRARPQRQISLGIRHLNDSSDLSRYYVMRNRGLVAHYLREHGVYRSFPFALGTALTFGKELLRLVTVEHSLRGVGRLVQGMKDAKHLPDGGSRTPR